MFAPPCLGPFRLESAAAMTDEDEMRAYIGKIVDKEAFDHKGLVYGMGHAVYSLSDPRAVVFKSFVQQLAMAKGRKTDFDFYNTVERLAPQVIAEKRHIYKGVSTNVDFYSGFVCTKVIPGINRQLGYLCFVHGDSSY